MSKLNKSVYKCQTFKHVKQLGINEHDLNEIIFIHNKHSTTYYIKTLPYLRKFITNFFKIDQYIWFQQLTV